MNSKKQLVGVIIVGITLVVAICATTTPILLLEQAAGFQQNPAREAPPAISGDNVYVAWWTNKTGLDEVMFRASTDGGATFSDKINLSNSTGLVSDRAEIAAEGGNVVVTWWESNQTIHPHTEEPVARISTDNGATFGPVLNLATNGTIGEAAAGEEEPPAEEEEPEEEEE
jgi:hypothetical protein